MSPKSVPQQLEVTLAAGNAIYVEISPATNKSTPLQLGTVRGGDSQTVTIRPVE